MESSNRLQHITNCLVEFRRLWLIPAILGLLLATAYAFILKNDTWTARQTMIMRDDLLGQQFKPGTFVSQEALKSAQETILETARRPEVIQKVLEKLGPEPGLLGLGGADANWPSKETIEDTRSAVSFESANGGEVGKSEVIVLATKSSSPKRSVEFLSLLLEQVDQKLSEIQADRFESMEAELRATCESALRTREQLEEKVKEFDANLGTDILALKGFNNDGGSPSAFEQKLNQIYEDRRVAERKLSELRSQMQSLADARNSSFNELPSSSELLANQPTLANKYESLSKARQKLSEAEGLYYPAHPKYRAAKQQVAAVHQQIKNSLGTVERGISAQVKAQQDAIALLDSKLQENNETLLRASRYRAPYETATKELEKQNEDYSEASARLARVQSRKLASDSIKLLTRVGAPSAATRPDGLGKKALSLIGGIAGLMIGFGLVMIVAPPYEEQFLAAARTNQSNNMDGSQMLGNYLAENRRRSDSGVETVQPQTSSQQPQPPAQPAPTPAASAPAPTPEPVPTPAITSPESHQSVENTVSYNEPATQATTPAPVTTQPAAPAVQTQPAAPAVQTPPVERTPDPTIALPQTPAIQIPESIQPPATSETSNVAPEAYIESEIEEAFGAAPPVQIPSLNMPPAVQIPDSALGSNLTGGEPASQPAANMPTASQPTAEPPSSTPSKTLAAIFANMPQPRTDIAIDSGEGDSSTDKPEDESPSARDEAQTIQLPGDIASGAADDSLSIQRRASYRPVDLAKNHDLDSDIEGEQSSKSQSIDSVFSELNPTRRQPDLPRQQP